MELGLQLSCDHNLALFMEGNDGRGIADRRRIAEFAIVGQRLGCVSEVVRTSCDKFVCGRPSWLNSEHEVAKQISSHSSWN